MGEEREKPERVQKKIEDILKEGLISAKEHAEVIAHIINAVDALSQREDAIESGKKRKLE